MLILMKQVSDTQEANETIEKLWKIPQDSPGKTHFL
jgi:hypothetical protein